MNRKSTQLNLACRDNKQKATFLVREATPESSEASRMEKGDHQGVERVYSPKLEDS